MIHEDRKELLKYALGATTMILLLQTMGAVRNGIFHGSLIGTDPYSWLYRVLHLHETGNWFNATLPRIDPPYGLEQHWTRPFDVLLFIGAWLGAPLVGFKNALHVWGALISPILQILALLCFIWTLLPVFTKRQISVLGILFAFQPCIIASFMAGRPDHQSLMLLLFILTLGLGTRLLLQTFRLRWCYATGLVSTFAIWVSIESLLVVLVILVCLGIFWLWEEDHLARSLFHYSLSLFVTSALALAVQKGWSRLWEPTLDQISLVYIILFGLILAFWAIVCAIGRQANRRKRFGLIVVGFLTVSTLMALLFPTFFSGPFADVDDLFRRAFLVNISELQPVFIGGWRYGLRRFFLWVGIAIPTIPVLAYHLVRRKKPDMRFWALVSVGLLIYLPLAIFRHIHFLPYVVILLLPGYAWLAAKIVQTTEGRFSMRGGILLRYLVLFTCTTWFLLPTFILEKQNKDIDWRMSCPLASLSRYLDDPQGWGDRPRNVLAPTDFGPELLYRTKHSVYSIPNHRFQRGFTDAYDIMSASTDDVSLKIIRNRRVDLILICSPQEDHFFNREDGLETFYDRLSMGKIPAWIRDVKLPDDLCAHFRLYEVRLP